MAETPSAAVIGKAHKPASSKPCQNDGTRSIPAYHRPPVRQIRHRGLIAAAEWIIDRFVSRADHPKESFRQWITGLVVLAATIVGFFGFARLSREATLIVSIGILAGLVIFFWSVGRRKRLTRPR